jgi:hypothetical protein
MDIPVSFTSHTGKTCEIILHVIEDKITGDYLNAIEVRQPIDMQDARRAAAAIDAGLQKLGY